MSVFPCVVLKRQTLMSTESTMTVEESGITLQIPAELVELSVRFGVNGMGRAVSALYTDVESLFPGGLPNAEDK